MNPKLAATSPRRVIILIALEKINNIRRIHEINNFKMEIALCALNKDHMIIFRCKEF